MIYSVDLDEIAGKINHIDFCKYLVDLNWLKFNGKTISGVQVYQKYVNDNFYQITIPCDRSLRDYNIAMRKAVEILSLTENRSEEQLILELLNPISDILRVRQISNSVENGSILFEDAISLFENSKKLLTNAASDAIAYKKFYKGRVSDKVQKFISKCKYGQTEIGSYVISLVCPLVDFDNEGNILQYNLFSEKEYVSTSITRCATKKLIESINIIKNTIENGEDLDKLVEDEEKSISVSFIESLANLNIDKENNELEIKAKWAPTIKDNVPNISKISISNEYYKPMKNLVDKYKIEDEKMSKTIEGKIFKLMAESQIETRNGGIAQLSYISQEKKVKQIKLKLDRDNYNTAIIAHKNGNTVRAIGEVEGNSMNNVTLIIL